MLLLSLAFAFSVTINNDDATADARGGGRGGGGLLASHALRPVAARVECWGHGGELQKLVGNIENGLC
jgi:hypothetical protein